MKIKYFKEVLFMKVVIKSQNEVQNVGDAYVVNNPNFLYSDNLVVRGEGGTYVACGTYNSEENSFELLDVERPAYFVGDDKEFSYEKLMDLADADDLGNYASEVEFTIE